MNLPPFVYSLSFWNAVAILVAVVAVQLGYDTVDSAKVLGAILAVLQLLNIQPELRLKGLA